MQHCHISVKAKSVGLASCKVFLCFNCTKLNLWIIKGHLVKVS